jgi:sugar lactone lactonase YvrE
MSLATGIAIDSSGDAWVSISGGSKVVELSSSGAILSGISGYSAYFMSWPNAIAIDGSGNVWIADRFGPSLAEFSSTGAILSPSGYGGSSSVTINSYPYGVAIDGSGNVWVSYQGTNAVAEFVGVGTPVVTPLAAGVKNNMLGTRP